MHAFIFNVLNLTTMAAISVSMNHVTTMIIFFVFLSQVTVMVNVCFANGDQSNILCHETEKQALLSFKRDLVDDYNKLVSWDVSKEEDCCKWAGISCNTQTGHVSKLSLADGFFTGKINPSLLNLTHLINLDLSEGYFVGIKIPSFMGSFVSLRYLNLTQGGFTGMIPHQLGNLSSLLYLGLGDNYDLYVESLHWVSGLSSLKSLVMNWVNLSEASDHWLFAINTLPSLQEACLGFCDLGDIHFPSHINLTSLETLDLSYNSLDLSPIPCTIRNNMSLLKHLDLSGNNINSVIPKCFYSFPRLQHLHLSNNKLQGIISSDVANLTSIVSLDLSYNALVGKIPTSMGNKLCNLEEFNLEYNGYKGSVSIVFKSLSGCLAKKLKSLNLGGNLFDSFTGPTPKSIFENFISLKSLDLSYNQLSGPLPKSFGSLSNLEILNIASNNFEGDVSEVHFANLTKLIEIHAFENNLTMKVSSYWSPPFSLDSVDLRNWNLGPHFPVWLKSQKHISQIDMSSTGISDAIPSWLWNFSSYNKYGGLSIDLSKNQIYGEIPEFPNDGSYYLNLSYNKLTGSLPHIPVDGLLDLSNNYLAGSISNFLCYPKTQAGFMALYLENNLLSGKIPNCWMYWPLLFMIDLDNNNLTGKIPSSIGSLYELRSLHIHNNNLIGEIPASLKNCSALIVLDLSFNKLVGTIPRWIGSLPMLRFLVLRSNNLTDLIPVELCQLSSLQVLDASNNNLTGIIPKCFKNLTAMTSSSNKSMLPSFVFGTTIQRFRDNVSLVIKGRENQYDNILYLLITLDLSDNKLSGEIPEELTSLDALQSLNLSGNYLSGSIPKKIGYMTKLESLDLSRNRMSGHIPSGMSNLTFLSFLNLSYNNFSGQIPTSTQLQTMDASSFIGNKLCGPPLLINCREDHVTLHRSADDGETQDDEYWFRLGIGMGFGVSFAGVIGLLLVCGFWRCAYFWFVEEHLWYKFVDYFIKVKYMF